jgi:uncharacterized membrane protein
MSHHDDEEDRHGHRRKRSAEASLTSGIVFTVAFGIAWAVTGAWWFIFPMVFAGVMPMAEGIRRLTQERAARPRAELKEEASAEKQVLQAAKEERGLITPALVALRTELSIQEAEKLLDDMAQKGYAVMHVTDSGRVEYEFPEFVPRLPKDDAESV